MAKKKFIIEFEADTSGFDSGVKDVKESIEEVSTATDEANSSFETVGETFSGFQDGLVSGFKGGVKGIRSMIKGMTGLKAAIAATGVGLLVVALGSLVSWMKNTEAGSKTLRTASTALDLVWKDMTDSLAKLTSSVVEGEEEQSNWLKTTVQWTAGLVGAAGVVDMFGEKIDEATEIAAEMVEVQEELIQATAFYTETNANLNQEIETQQKIIDDTTKSYAERKAAVDRQNIATLDLAENTRLQAELELETLQNTLAITQGYEDQQGVLQEIADAKATLIDAETRLAVIELDNAQKSREIDLQELERKKSIYNTIANLKLESITDEEERINEEFALRERQLMEELELQRASDEEELMALELLNAAKLVALEEFNEAKREKEAEDRAQFIEAEKAFAAEKKAEKDAELQSFRDAEKAYSDSQKKQREEDAAARVALAQGVAESTANVLGALDAFTDKSTKKGFERSKKIGIAQAVMSTLTGVVNALSASSVIPDPFGTILKGVNAAAIAVTGAAQISKIKSTTFGSSGSVSAPSFGTSSGAAVPDVGGGVAAPAVDFSFLETGANQNTVQAYVVEQDVSNSQQANQLIEDQAAL